MLTEWQDKKTNDDDKDRRLGRRRRRQRVARFSSINDQRRPIEQRKEVCERFGRDAAARFSILGYLFLSFYCFLQGLLGCVLVIFFFLFFFGFFYISLWLADANADYDDGFATLRPEKICFVRDRRGRKGRIAGCARCYLLYDTGRYRQDCR